MDFRHLIVTCLFSKLRLPFDNQKVKENYAILFYKDRNKLNSSCLVVYFYLYELKVRGERGEYA